MEDSSEFVTTDLYYFSLGELSAAFQSVVARDLAVRLVKVWGDVYKSCLKGDLVVRLPDGFIVQHPIADVENKMEACAGDEGELVTSVESALASHVLIRFTDGTLVLLAASSPHVQKRFDSLGLQYAKGTVVDPVKLSRYIDFLREISGKSQQ